MNESDARKGHVNYLKRKINILPFGIFDYPIMGPDDTLDELSS